MAEQRSIVNSVSRVGVLARGTSEVERLEKGESALAVQQQTERALSEPSSLKIAAANIGRDGQAKGKSTLQKPPNDVSKYRVFRRLCDTIFEELGRIDAFFVKEEVSDEGVEVVAEVEALLEELYSNGKTF